MALSKKIEPKENIKKAFEFCRRATSTNKFYVIFLDGNGIKAVNDKYGHLVGDTVIEEMANTLAKFTREQDRIIRFGGDEFVLFLSNFDKSAIKDFVQRMQNEVRNNAKLISLVGGINVSIGVVEYDHEYHGCLDRALEEADTLMYSAKVSPPHYVIFSEDVIQTKNEKHKCRKTKGDNPRKRSYFSWVVARIAEENPEYNLQLLIEISRKVWKSRGIKIINNDTPKEIFNLINTLYKKEANIEQLTKGDKEIQYIQNKLYKHFGKSLKAK